MNNQEIIQFAVQATLMCFYVIFTGSMLFLFFYIFQRCQNLENYEDLESVNSGSEKSASKSQKTISSGIPSNQSREEFIYAIQTPRRESLQLPTKIDILDIV